MSRGGEGLVRGDEAIAGEHRDRFPGDRVKLGDGAGAGVDLAVRSGGETQGVPIVRSWCDLKTKAHSAVAALVPLGGVHVQAEIHFIEATQQVVHVVHGLVDLLDRGLIVEQLADGAIAVVDAVGHHLQIVGGALETLGHLAGVSHDALQFGTVLLQDGVEVLAHGFELLGQLGQPVPQIRRNGFHVRQGVIDGPVILLCHGAKFGGQDPDVIHDLIELLPALFPTHGFVQGLGDALHVLTHLSQGLHEAVETDPRFAGQGDTLGERALGTVAGIQVHELFTQDANGAQGDRGI